MADHVTVRLTLFASLRDKAGLDQFTLRVKPCSIGELYRTTAVQYGFDLPEHWVRFAANDHFVSADYVICEGDRLVFIPPVSGG